MLIEWIHCPICGGKTRNKIRADTELRNYPLYCPKCKKESLQALFVNIRAALTN